MYTASSSQQKLSVRTKVEAAVMASMDNTGEAVERATSGRAKKMAKTRGRRNEGASVICDRAASGNAKPDHSGGTRVSG